MQKVKKKLTLKRIKRIFINVWKEIVHFFKSLYERFMELPKNIRYIIYVWLGVIAIILVIIIATTTNNKYLDKYELIESDMNKAMLDYVQENELYPLSESKLKIDVNVLIDYNYLNESDIIDNKCQGFSVAYYSEDKEDYVINSYLNCKNYTTKGYSDYK